MKRDLQQWFVGLFILGCITTTPEMFAMTTPLGISPTAVDHPNRYVHPVVNSDQLKGNWKQFKGELKKKWADITDDDLLYIEGHNDKLNGKIQERYGDRRKEVKQWIDEWFERHDAQGRNRAK
ncbi:MAG TPA: CsbD family protein [Nitrospira sp.]|nr:CsbD family protein [Nitrospira sp.]